MTKKMMKKMTKKGLCFVVMFAVLMLCSVTAIAEIVPYPATIEEARLAANQELGETVGWIDFYGLSKIINGSLLSLNEAAWRSHTALAYGTYFGSTAANGEHRYLGYNPLGNEFPNPDYPPDSKATTGLNGWNWVEEPWWDEFLWRPAGGERWLFARINMC